ncbi:MAG: urease subunit gamma [Cyanobacteria bacterium P01_F01_bin.86]
MYLTPRELERFTIFTAAEIARRRKERGLKLNVPEAIAYITDFIIEGAREDKSVAELMSEGATLLSVEDVLPGVSDLIPLVQVEAHFLDGTKLVSIHNPIRPLVHEEVS